MPYVTCSMNTSHAASVLLMRYCLTRGELWWVGVQHGSTSIRAHFLWNEKEQAFWRLELVWEILATKKKKPRNGGVSRFRL